MTRCAQVQIGERVVTVDAEDAHVLNEERWYIHRSKKCEYVCAGRGATTRLHRVLVSARPGDLVDHVNGDTMDNRRSNLRIVTASRSNTNRTGWGRSKVKGVFFDTSKKRWRARLRYDGSSHHLGYFDTEAEAVVAVREHSMAVHGEFRS